MKLVFEKIIIHNFLSLGHAEVDFQNKGYCKVSGVNNNPLDRASSNGAGKSSVFSAICYALTGETSQGVKSNIKNINVDENSCYVTLFFKADNDEYEITRYKEPKADLKIKINGKDESGKGIRESETILAEKLPDLTSSLIASIIILGQGLPNKFTGNSPSGRKEVLEQLSKSDFMIEDLKSRLANRMSFINGKIREVEDALLALTSKKSVSEQSLNQANEKLNALNKETNFDTIISDIEKQLAELKSQKDISEVQLTTYSNLSETLNEDFNKINSEKSALLESDMKDFTDFTTQYLNKKSELNASIKILDDKIKQLKSIKDICPTCGQKIPNVIKPSTENEEKELAELKLSLADYETKYSDAKKSHDAEIKNISDKYVDKITSTQKSLNDNKNNITNLTNQLKTLNTSISEKDIELATAKTNKDNYLKNISDIKNNIAELENSIKNFDAEILYNSNDKALLSNRFDVLTKLKTLIQRDFRGFLLNNIIDFISKQSKNYCMDVFGTDKLDFVLDGNNIDISYCNKPLENLSGGERQRVDIIIQFAIRDMMSQYLGFSSNILVLDEIFDALDAVSCTQILNLISTRLNDVESIYIISHRASELEIPYDSELIVIKDETGVSKIK